MRKKWVGYVIAISLCIGLFIPTVQVKAADSSVKVSLPVFEVKLNGHKIDNLNREYPLLVYRDITYIPMTSNDSRLLGLETTVSQATGLTITKSKVTNSYMPTKSKRPNSNSYTATKTASTIIVNGKVINNSTEKYPLLNFRNVTYVPLTWRFAHDEFGWDYKFNAASGLSITSDNPQLKVINLPSYAIKNDVAFFKGYYYFVETKATTNHVYRAPVNKPADNKEVYSYNFSPETFSNQVYFQILENRLWFSYSPSVGLITGTTFHVNISADGKTDVIYQGLGSFRDTPYGTLFITNGMLNEQYGSLYIKEDNKSRSVGDSSMMFADHINNATTVVGDNVYVLCKMDYLNKTPSFIYRINLKTNKTEQIVNANVRDFQIVKDKLYYINKDEKDTLYSSSLDGTGETKLSEHAVSWFDSVDGNLFYTTKKKSNQYDLYKFKSNGKDQLVWTSPVAGVQVLNKQLIGQLGGSNGIVILDSSGNLIVKIVEPIAKIVTSDKGLLLQKSNKSYLTITP